MPVNDYSGNTFVAFLDISGFKELMKNEKEAIRALEKFYQAGYDILHPHNGVEGFFVSDCGILFVRDMSDNKIKLKKILDAVKEINEKMLQHNFMLTTSIAYGSFNYRGKLEFEGIEKNSISGYAYVNAFLDNEKGLPKLQPGECRVIKENLPQNLDLSQVDFELLKERGKAKKCLYYYWNVRQSGDIENFEKLYNDSYKLKYEGMLTALKRFNS